MVALDLAFTVILSLLALYSAYYLSMFSVTVMRSRRCSGAISDTHSSSEVETSSNSAGLRSRPFVSIVVPVKNERYVVRRLLEACSNLMDRYGREFCELIIVDDSVDDTVDILRELVTEYNRRGYRVLHLHRGLGDNSCKADALNYAMKFVKGDYVVLFDADFIPPPDILLKTIPELESNPRLGYIQCCWEHINRNYNIVTRIASLNYELQFLIEHPAKSTLGAPVLINGSACILKREAIEDAGGWQLSLAEDLDLAVRMWLRGWRGKYKPDIVCYCEAPPNFMAFRRQQFRWALGYGQTARRLLKTVLGASTPLNQKLDVSVTLLRHTVYPLMLTLIILLLMYSLLNEVPRDTTYISSLASFLTISPWIIFTYVAFRKSSDITSFIKEIFTMFLFSLAHIGLALSNSIAYIIGLVNTHYVKFRRTPKYDIRGRGDKWVDKVYQVRPGILPFIELAIASLLWFSIARWFSQGNIPLGLGSLPFALGLTFTSVSTIVHWLSVIKHGVVHGEQPW